MPDGMRTPTRSPGPMPTAGEARRARRRPPRPARGRSGPRCRRRSRGRRGCAADRGVEHVEEGARWCGEVATGGSPRRPSASLPVAPCACVHPIIRSRPASGDPCTRALRSRTRPAVVHRLFVGSSPGQPRPHRSGKMSAHELRAPEHAHRTRRHDRHAAGTGPGLARRCRDPLGRGVDRAGPVRVRPHRDPRAGLLDRHAAADGVRLAARRPRVLLHAHRRRRALPADARPRGVLPDGLGRQRPAHRASRAELLRRALRPVAAVRGRLRAAVRGRRGQVRRRRCRSAARTSSSCASA